jgi:hypothetical protein
MQQYQTAKTDRQREAIWPLLWREMAGIIAMLLKKVGPMQHADHEDVVSSLKIKFLRGILPRFDASRGRSYTLLYLAFQRAIWTYIKKSQKHYCISYVGGSEDLIIGYDNVAAPHDSTLDELLCN